jgi:hypothetical protein
VPGRAERPELESGVDDDPDREPGEERAGEEHREEEEVTHGYGCDLGVLR